MRDPVAEVAVDLSATRQSLEEIKGFCSICVSRCGTINTISGDALLKVRADPLHPNGKAVCMKGKAAPELVHHPDRLMYPMRRTSPKGAADPGWQRMSWDHALSEIAARLATFKEESGAESVVVGSTTPSGSLTDSFDWVKRFAQVFGTPNYLGTTEICNWHKDDANLFTFGCPTPPGDHANADVILLWGNNPANTWLAQAEAISRGRSRGAKLIVVDPRQTGLARDADLWLPVRPGTDAALAMGIANALVVGDNFDREFVEQWTNGPLLVRMDTGQFLRERDLHPHATPNRFAVWDAARQIVNFTGAIAGEPRSDIEPHGAIDVRTVDKSGALHTVKCRKAFDIFTEALSSFTPERTEEITGVPAKDIVRAAGLLTSGQRISHYAWSGVGQQTNATQTARAIATLYALTGSFDRKGGNWKFTTLPTNKLDDYQGLVAADQRMKTIGLKERPLGPASKGVISIDGLCKAVLDAEPYRVRGLVTFGLAPHTSYVDVQRVDEALKGLEFHVHCDLFETPASRHADILLPACAFPEREALRVGFDISEEAVEHVQLRPRLVSPRGESRPDYQIVIDLAARLDMAELFFGGSVERGWDYVLSPMDISVATLRRIPGGLRRPIKQYEKKYALTNSDGKPSGFATETARVELYSEQLLRNGCAPVPEYVEPFEHCGSRDRFPLMLTSAKSGYYCHSQHRNIVSLRKRAPYPTVEMSMELADRRGIQEGDWVRVVTASGSSRLRAKIAAGMAANVVVAEFGWWQACDELGLGGMPAEGARNSNFSNLVTAAALDPISGSAPLRSLRCDIELEPNQIRSWQGFREFVVAEVAEEAEGVRSVKLAPADGQPIPDFLPGQHVSVQVPALGGEVRSYSLTGLASDAHRRCYSIAVRHVRFTPSPGETVDGVMSGHIHRTLDRGHKVFLKAPSGSFVMPTRSRRPVVLFAGGIGITPFLSYLETIASQAEPPAVWLYYANRNPSSQAFAQRIAELKTHLPTLQVFNAYDDPNVKGGDIIGRLTADVVDVSLVHQRARFYFCGPEPMMNGITAQLLARGVPSFDIFREAFKSPAKPTGDPDQTFQVTFSRSQKAIVWSPDKGSLLAFAERNGISLPSGCRVGQCESCAVRLISGNVSHMHGDGPEEAGMCLACQAIPICDIVVDA